MLVKNSLCDKKFSKQQISSFKIRHNFFKDSFLPAVISECNNLDINIRNYSCINVYKKELLKLIRPEPNSTNNINDTKRLKLLTRLKLFTNYF